MIIENEIKTRRIQFIKLESVKEKFPTHRIQIRFETENIKADFENYIWVSDSGIAKFLNELDTLDRTRKGQAILASLGPGEMNLIFKSIDTLGHLSVFFKFVKEDKINKDYSYDVQIEFQIDPTSLKTVRNGLLNLTE